MKVKKLSKQDATLVAKLAALRKRINMATHTYAKLVDEIKSRVRCGKFVTKDFNVYMGMVEMDVVDMEKLRKAGLYKKFVKTKKYKRLDITRRKATKCQN